MLLLIRDKKRISLTRPKIGTKWCSHMENMSISFTITISSWSSSKIASFRTSAGTTTNQEDQTGHRQVRDMTRDDGIMNSLYFTRYALPVVSFLLAHIIAQTYPVLSRLFLWGFLISCPPISGKVSVETWQTWLRGLVEM